MRTHQKIKFIVEQIHEKDEVVRDFEIPVDMAVYYKDGKIQRFTQKLKSSTETFSVNRDGDIDFILF